jgi:hypothetical protein
MLAVVPETPQPEDRSGTDPRDQWADTSHFTSQRWHNAWVTHRQLDESASQPY